MHSLYQPVRQRSVWEAKDRQGSVEALVVAGGVSVVVVTAAAEATVMDRATGARNLRFIGVGKEQGKWERGASYLSA